MAIDKYNHDPKKNTPAEQQALRTLRTPQRPQVLESDFARYYVFGLHDRTAYPEQFNAWLDVASTVNHAVDVIQGEEVIFTVPPLLMPYPTEVEYDSSRAITNIVDRALGNGAINPALVEKSLRQELSAHLRGTMQGDEGVALLAEHVSAWDEIFARYNLPMRYPAVTEKIRQLSATIAGKQPVEEKKEDHSDSSFDYDQDFE